MNRNDLIYVPRSSGNRINTTKQQIRKNEINILIGLYRYRLYYRYIDRYVRVLQRNTIILESDSVLA
jgi:hypothetical protein